MFVARFDFRIAPHAQTSRHDLFAAALDMAEWAEANGAASVMFNQHHGSPDGYLPSPLILAAAAAARTSTLPISIGALLALLYEPVKLAEDIIALDHLSAGRVSYTIGLGYRDEEYAMFGVDRSQRATLMEERLHLLRRALAGESFEWQGRTIEVSPGPFTPGGPFLAYGGNSEAAARRAARHGLMLFAENDDPRLHSAYDAEAHRVGNPTGMVMAPPMGQPTTVFVAHDVDAAWDQIGPYLLHDARSYAAWMGPSATAASYSGAATVADLRAEQGAYRIVTPIEAIEMISTNAMVSLQPLCGGLPPEVAWTSLRLIETEVLPAFGPPTT